MQRHLFLVGYDISDRRTRCRALRAVKGFAVGGQKSVYECWYTSGEMQEVMHALRQLIDPATDRVFFLRLDPRAARHALGTAVPVPDDDYFLVS